MGCLDGKDARWERRSRWQNSGVKHQDTVIDHYDTNHAVHWLITVITLRIVAASHGRGLNDDKPVNVAR